MCFLGSIVAGAAARNGYAYFGEITVALILAGVVAVVTLFVDALRAYSKNVAARSTKTDV